MCGIIGVVRRPADREPPSPADVLALIDDALALFPDASPLDEADALLRGVPGVRALLDNPSLAGDVRSRIDELDRRLAAREAELDAAPPGTDVEAVNAALVRVKDAVWAIRNDRLRTGDAVRALLADGEQGAGDAAVAAYLSIQVALSALDRLEVRGRDSAGIHVLVTGHDLDLDEADVRAELERRGDPLFTSGAVRTPEGHLAFVYKAAAEIGELGDNTRALRAAITADDLLRRALAAPTAEATVLGHTRWASVGIISEPNAHPLDSLEEGRDNPYAVAALNGDVDNHADLVEAFGLCLPAAVTTDAKVIPTLVARRRSDGDDLVEAFRASASSFDGSVAIALTAAEAPGRLLLAQRGSGQSLYVGLAEDAFVVASEPYGLIEETRRYVRMDGETPSGRDGTSGQVLVVDRDTGLRRLAYDGTELPLTDADVVVAEITTRDIDRGGAPHYLLKEIAESPHSVRKTLRGKIVDDTGRLAVSLPSEALPDSVRERLGSGAIRRVLVIGQGTAAVAGQSLAAFLDDAFVGSSLSAAALPATELSGFSLVDDMSDALVIAISQSGTTTDTNRTVDLVRARGASVLAIVNRRNSDLVERADGVLYTSDGRDVEMSVASTKAFYAQIAAGVLLALAIADAAGCGDRSRASDLLAGLRGLPAAMDEVLARREVIADAAAQYAPARRYWAIVGNGRNRIAAQEIRIKLSELCYKAIAADATEDKKHIDLSSEPLIVVCAAGLSGATADDVAKEVAIYRAHKAAPVVIATEGARFSSALTVLEVPAMHPALAFVLSAMTGHLFGYEAALAIDAQARQLREIRAAVEAAVSERLEGDGLLRWLDRALETPVAGWFRTLRSGALNGHLEAATAVRLSSLFGYATGRVPVEAYEAEYGRVGTPEAVVNDLLDALNDAVDELTRPIDAIKHQAKTVTVGISRSEEAYFDSRLVREVLAAGAGRDRLSYRTLRTLAELDPAVDTTIGWTRYAVEGDVAEHTATATIVDRGGIARDIPSRTDRDPRLTGTKHRAAFEREVTVAVGRRDDRPIIIVPETKDNQVTGLTLLHVRFHAHLAADEARRVLSGYRGRYQALVDAVTETEPTFDDSVLAAVPLLDLLSEPVYVLASHWRQPQQHR